MNSHAVFKVTCLEVHGRDYNPNPNPEYKTVQIMYEGRNNLLLGNMQKNVLKH